jgi:hypothetical protein
MLAILMLGDWTCGASVYAKVEEIAGKASTRALTKAGQGGRAGQTDPPAYINKVTELETRLETA